MSERVEVAVVVLWHGAELVMEERWVDVKNDLQETRYAFPGGKVESGESQEDAAIREIHEEVGIDLDRGSLTRLEDIEVGKDVGHFFQAQIPYGSTLRVGNIILITRQELDEHKKKGKLMPLTNEYVERYF